MPPSAGPQLTPRQREVLDLMARGYTNAQIGEQLGISLDGAKWHVSEVLTRLDVESREEAADYWSAEQGLRPRLLRFARGASAGLSWRWVAGIGASAAAGAGVILAVMALTSGDDGTPAAALEDPSASPQATATATVAARLTGVPEVDAIIDLALAGDVPALVPLFDGQPEPCSTLPPQGVGARPLCPSGVADGSEVLTVRATSCERWQVEALLVARFQNSRELYAAFEPEPGTQYGPYPSGEYALVFAADDDGYERFDVRDGRIAGMWTGCGGGFNTLMDMVDDVSGPFLVAPSFPVPTPTPTPGPDRTGYPQHWQTGEPMLDIAIQALVSGNADRVRAHFEIQETDCANVFAARTRVCQGDPPPAGTLMVFPVDTCRDGDLYLESELEGFIAEMSDASNRLYAANINLPPTDDAFNSDSGDFVAVINVPAKDDAFVVFVTEGMITSIDFGCDETAARRAEGLPRAGVDGVILPPPP